MNNNYVFILFYMSIVSICLLGSLFINHSDSFLNSSLKGNITRKSTSKSNGDVIGQSTSVSTSSNYIWLNFTFTWGSDSQRIVQNEFCITVQMQWGKWKIENVTTEELRMYIEINDDDFGEWDYVGLVFDTNRNGYIDQYDRSTVLFANNMTQPSILCDNGLLAFAETMPIRGPQTVSFDPDKGYIFRVSTIHIPIYKYPWDPTPLLKEGCNNPVHICFCDRGHGHVFVRFVFHIPAD